MAFHNVPPNGFPDLPDMEEVEAVVKDVTNLKTSVAGLSEDVSDLNDNKANQITIAPFFDEETAYEVGDLVYYNGLSYRCTNAHEGEWDADDFAATTIANELGSLMSGLIKKTHYTETTDTDGDVAINVSVGNIVAIIPDRSKGEDGCYTSWFTGLISTNTQGTFYSIKFVDATLAKIASTKMAFDVLYT